tara:strand:+ start:1647 stop:2666 length:1020 start_codon:yes stop_codon:yes gene_type:complete
MARYATGKKSKAISDRSGFKVKYTDLMTTWDGLRVEKEEYEPKHPQLNPAKNVTDATALLDPRPDNTPENVKFYIGYNYDPFLNDPRQRPPIGVAGKGAVGQVEARLVMAAQVTGVAGTGAVGTGYSLAINQSITQTGIAAVGFAAGSAEGTVIYSVSVVGGNPANHPQHNIGSSNKFAINGSTATADVTLEIYEGNTYRFDQSDSSNLGHPLRFSTVQNGTHAGGSEYTTGVTVVGDPGYSGAYTEITVAAGAPTLYYYCTNHNGMGWTANTPSAINYTLVAKTLSSGVAGTGAVGNQAVVGSPPTLTGVAGTGAVGTVSILLNGWGLGGWNTGTWGN